MPKFITKFVVPAAAVAALALSAATAVAQPGSSGAQCFARQNIEGFQAPDDHTVYLRVGVNQIYRLDLMVPCAGLSFRNDIGLWSTAGDPWICSPIEATVAYHEGGIPTRCPVSAIHRLTPAEVAALPKRDRP